MNFLRFLVILVTLSSTAIAAQHAVLIDGHEARANSVIARFTDDKDSPTKRQAVLDQLGVTVEKTFSIVDGMVVLRLNPGPQLNAVVPGGDDPATAGKRLKSQIKRLMVSGAFSYVEPNYIFTADLVPSDTAYQNGTLWGLDNIQAPTAWDTTTGSTAVTVAVIDSGVHYQHQDLVSQMWNNPGEIPNNGIDDDGDGYVDNVHGINAITNDGDPMDDNGHGTHVAGTIGASANDSGPHVGVAWNVRIMACKFLDASGSGSLDDALECIQFARAKGAQILNNSWGGGPYAQSLFDAIQATRNSGLLFVAAAGNESNNNDANPSYPASYNVDNVISVAAIDINNNIASFSNFGSQSVHLGAPGVNIYSSVQTSPSAYSSFNGTSMASPHVAGAAALLWAHFQPASVSGMLELRQRLLAGATPTPSLSGRTLTGARLNVADSLTKSPDSELEVAVFAEAGLTVLADRTASLFVQVSDLFPVTDATVGGTVSFTAGNVTFRNDGVAPDLTAGDNVYSASVDVPGNINSFTLDVSVTAPTKNPANPVVEFTVVPAPSNDFFAGREAITSIPATITASSLNATGEPGEPYHVVGFDIGQDSKSLWWTWTAQSSGVYSISTDGSDFDTMLAVYTGNSIDTLGAIDGNDDAGFDWTSTVVFPASSGVAYHFAVDGFYSQDISTTDSGGVQLNLSKNPTMVNDDFANRTPITGVDTTASGHNVGATAEFQEPFHGSFDPFSSVWWTWTAPQTGPVTISTAGSSFDTILGVYVGNSLSQLNEIASNDDVAFDVTVSEVTFQAQQGQAYQIAVDGFGIGNIQLHIAGISPNDNFGSPIILTGDLVESEGYNLTASSQSGEPSPVGNINGRSIWWRWTAPRSGKATITTDGSNFDTTLGVYTGNSVGSLSMIAENDDRVAIKIRTSLVSFAAVQGQTYHIQIDGFDGLAGRANLTLMMDGRSRLADPVLRADGSTTLDLLGEPNRIYVLESSSNLDGWTGVSTNTVVSRKVRFTEPSQSNDGRFYRARPASLLTD